MLPTAPVYHIEWHGPGFVGTIFNMELLSATTYFIDVVRGAPMEYFLC